MSPLEPIASEQTLTEVQDQIDEVIDEVEADTELSEERHTEILGRLDQCLTQLEKLSTTSAQAENPMLTQIVSQVAEIKGEIASLKSSLDSMRNNPTPNVSVVEVPMESAEPNPESLTEEPALAEPEAKERPKHRVV